MQSNANLLPIIYNFNFTLLFVKVMFPVNFANNLGNLDSKPSGF